MRKDPFLQTYLKIKEIEEVVGGVSVTLLQRRLNEDYPSAKSILKRYLYRKRRQPKPKNPF